MTGAERIEGGRHEYSPPKGLRKPPERRIYAADEDSKDYHLDLTKGSSNLGAPPYFSELVLDNILGIPLRTLLDEGNITKSQYDLMMGLVREGNFIQSAENYGRESLEEARRHIQDRFGLSGASDIFFSGGGSDELLRDILWLPDPDLRTHIYMVNPPTFPNIANFASLRSPSKMSYSGHNYPLNNPMTDGIQIALDRQPDPKRINAVINYICNPGNPKGDSADIAEIEKLIEKAAQRREFVIVDEAFGDALPDENSAIPLTEKYPNLIVLRSLSKVIGLPGERIGYAVMSHELGKVYDEIRRPYGMSGSQIFIANKVLEPVKLKKHLENVRKKTEEVKTYLLERLEEDGIKTLITDPRVSIFTAVGVSENLADILSERFMTKVVRGSEFYNTDQAMAGGRYIRINTPETFAEADNVAKLVLAANEAFW